MSENVSLFYEAVSTLFNSIAEEQQLKGVKISEISITPDNVLRIVIESKKPLPHMAFSKVKNLLAFSLDQAASLTGFDIPVKGVHVKFNVPPVLPSEAREEMFSGLPKLEEVIPPGEHIKVKNPPRTGKVDKPFLISLYKEALENAFLEHGNRYRAVLPKLAKEYIKRYSLNKKEAQFFLSLFRNS